MANTTKFLKVKKNAKNLLKVKAGDIYQYKINTSDRPNTADYFLESGRKGVGTDNSGIITDSTIIKDLDMVLLQGMYLIRGENGQWPADKSEEEEKRNQDAAKAASEREKQKSSSKATASKTATEMGVPTQAQQSSQQQSRASKAPSASKPTEQKPVNQTAKEIDRNRKAMLHTSLSSLTEKEVNILFTLAYKWEFGNLRDVKKKMSSMDISEKIDFIYNYIDFGLSKKKVADDEIPPLAILKKIPQVAENRELLVHYTRKINRIPPKVSLAGRLGQKLDFDVASLPPSVKASWFVAKTGFKGAELGAKLGAKGAGFLWKKFNELRDKNKSTGSASTQPVEKESSEELGSTQAESTASQPPLPSTQEGLSSKKLGGGSYDKETRTTFDKLTIAVYKLLDVLDQSKPTVKQADSSVIEKREDTTNIPTVQDDDKVEVEGGKEKGKSGGAFASLFGILKSVGGGLMKYLFTPLKLLGSGLVSLISTLGSVGASLLGKLAGGLGNVATSAMGKMGGLVKGAGALAAIGAVGYGAFKGTEALMETETGQKVSSYLGDKAMDVFGGEKNEAAEKQNAEVEAKTKEKMLAAGVSKDVVDKWSIKSNSLPKEYMQVLQAKKNQNMQAVPKSKSIPVAQAAIQKEAVMDAKEDAKQQQQIDASRKTNQTIINNGGGGGSRLEPRIMDSTFIKYRDSRMSFA